MALGYVLVPSTSKCPNCGSDNPQGKKFCGSCGASLPSAPSYEPAPPVISCPNCEAENPPSKRFCGDCGEILPRPEEQTSVDEPTDTEEYAASDSRRVRTEYLVVGGLIAAIFFGLFYWAVNFTYTEQVWHDLPYIGGYWETVTHTIDPAIQALFLVVAIIGLMAMVYGAVSRK